MENPSASSLERRAGICPRLSVGVILIATTAAAFAANPGTLSISMKRNPDGTLNPKFPCLTTDKSDCKPPGSNLTCTVANPPVLTGITANGTQISAEARSLFSGDEADTCTLNVSTITGDNVATKNWSISSGNLVNSNVNPGSVGSGSLAVGCTNSSAQLVQCPSWLWDISAPPGGDTTAPSTPTGLTSTAQTSNTITWTWNAATDNVGVTAYDVLLGIGDGAGNAVGSGSVVASPTTTSYIATGLNPLQQYYIRVRAKDLAGNLGSYTNRSFASTTAAPTGTIWYQDAFESTSSTFDTSLWTIHNSGSGSTHSNPTGTGREGNRAHRSDLTWSSHTNYRTEISGLMQAYRGLNSPEYFEDTWWGFSVKPTQDNIPASCIVAQWHGYGGFGPGDEADTVSQPILWLRPRYDTSRWAIGANYSPNQPSVGQSTSYSNQSLANVNWGQWHDFVFRIKWDYRAQPTAAGVLQVWMNGVLIVDQQDISIGYNDNQLPYFKMGMYCAGMKDENLTPNGTTRTYYHDAFRMSDADRGGSYDTVRPGQ